MDACTFDALLHQIGDLSSGQCAGLLSKLTSRIATATAADIIEATAAATLRCPRCQGTQLYRHGEANGLQRFQCRACRRTLKSL